MGVEIVVGSIIMAIFITIGIVLYPMYKYIVSKAQMFGWMEILKTILEEKKHGKKTK